MRFDQRAASSSATRGKAVDLTESAADRMRLGLLFVALLAFAPSLLLAKVTGNISGTVKDAQGAVVPGVTVTARNTQTGVEQKLETDSVGFYNFSALPVGTYDEIGRASCRERVETSVGEVAVETRHGR